MAQSNGEQAKKRFLELAGRAEAQGFWTETAFLTLAEQETLHRLRLPVPFALFGGYPEAERRLAAFGSEGIFGPYEPPIVCLKLEPVAPRFAEALTHRDFLGALMGLGVRREVTGDIVLVGNTAYLFCLASIASYIQENLGQVKRTCIRSAAVQPPPSLWAPLEPRQVVAPSERLDALVAAVYGLSRSEGKALVEAGRVCVGGCPAQNAGASLRPGATVSVRGLGRFYYDGIARETKKGRLRVTIRVP